MDRSHTFTFIIGEESPAASSTSSVNSRERKLPHPSWTHSTGAPLKASCPAASLCGGGSCTAYSRKATQHCSYHIHNVIIILLPYQIAICLFAIITYRERNTATSIILSKFLHCTFHFISYLFIGYLYICICYMFTYVCLYVYFSIMTSLVYLLCLCTLCFTVGEWEPSSRFLVCLTCEELTSKPLWNLKLLKLYG